MKLIINSEIKTSCGNNIANAFCDISANTDRLLLENKVTIEPSFYVDYDAKINSYDKIIPILTSSGGTITERVGGFHLTLSDTEKVDFNPIMAYTKVKTYLESKYSWVVSIV